jgi:ADP-ribose pyrophosphatase YjhB (NUDIX family)
MRNAFARLLWRVAYRALWLSSFVVRRRGRGAKCLLFNAGQVLLVRHTYGPKEWELPGGGVRRAEDPFAGIQRELREELQVEVEHAASLGTGSGPGRFAGARVSYFLADGSQRRARPRRNRRGRMVRSVGAAAAIRLACDAGAGSKR